MLEENKERGMGEADEHEEGAGVGGGVRGQIYII